MPADRLVLEAPDARLVVDPIAGGRLASLAVRGEELLVTAGAGPIYWGSYPMAPFAGRIRDGRFTFRGRAVQLPRNLPPHAIHGTVFQRPWTVTGPDSLAVDLGPDWPFRGRVSQRFSLTADGLHCDLTLEADELMPVTLGWHPWFRRSVAGRSVDLRVAPGRMYERGADGLPTGRLVSPAPRPWDDCFVAVAAAPIVAWPGFMELTITSSADHWVIYDEAADGVCIEPQTGPPDAVNLDRARTIVGGESLDAWMAWSWSAAHEGVADRDHSAPGGHANDD